MRFLVITESRQALPIEAAGKLMEALIGWAKQYSANKKFEQIWSFAGVPGGGGIINVASIEELDAVMSEFPLSQFSNIKIYPLVDLDRALSNALNAFKKMTPP